MTRYFITGAQGFVGRYLVARLLCEGHAYIMGVGRSPRIRDSFTHTVQWGSEQIPAPLTDDLTVIEESSRYHYTSACLHQVDEMKNLLAEFRPDVVIHLASGLRDDPPATLLHTNVEGTLSLLTAIGAVALGVKKIVIGSSGGVYGAPDKLPIRESHVCAPKDFYSLSKLAQEHVARILAEQQGWRLAFARIFNVVGPGQDERHICGQFAAKVAGILSNRSRAVISHGPLHTTRDLIDVRDVAQGIALIANPAAPEGVFNVGRGDESSMQEVLDTILDLAGLRGQVLLECRTSRPGDVPRHVASIDQLRSLGFRPAYGLRKSLKDLLAYYLSEVPAVALAGRACTRP